MSNWLFGSICCCPMEEFEEEAMDHARLLKAGSVDQLLPVVVFSAY
jgi:hypothetical protein